ncbi:putative ubiquitinyl hydrolase 1 [Helianthus annuus]|nr:putative ubiquitinyl hydrolase 1 [Helianthus annuus]KAJ0474776.1 putative ubiquitinyl hydrolase 1 [Helianthus annuus]KAJ0650330.1 putative ubiquitinyl hydrolase 1 [Helianthus annuus]
MSSLAVDSKLQMSWQNNNLLLKKRKNGLPLGFKNLGNTCYLNAVLQCLTYTPPLANFCLQLQHSAFCESLAQQDKSDCPFCLLEERIFRSLSSNLTLDTPGKIIGGLKVFAEHFRLGRQEDAHEFLRYVIDACHTTCLRLKKLQQQRRKVTSNGGGDGFSGSSVVKEIFGGALQSQVKCLACGNESNKVDEIMDISIDVLNSNSLKDAFENFFRPEYLDGNNKYKCESCKKLVPARKQMSILQAPNILVIQLKRFEGIYGGKIDKAITFEERLVLSSFMCKRSQDPHPEYKLFATIIHSGYSPDSGHYYAYIKDAIGRWYCCNDSYVSVSTLEEVLSEKVYILFFCRTKQRPLLPNKNLTTNGTKSYDCNGNDSSKVPKSSHLMSTDSQQPKVDPAASTKVEKLLNGSQKKPGCLGTNGVKKFPEFITHNKENNATTNGTETGKLHNGIVKNLSNESDLQRKHKEQKSCDHKSLAKHDELKESLRKEASSFLRNCGFSDDVASFMRAKKLSIRDEGNDALQRNELKRKMIADAKAKFISQVPQSLKSDLVKRIRSHIDP